MLDNITDHLPLIQVYAPWAATIVGSTIARLRRPVEASGVKTIAAVTAQLTAAGHGGQVKYRTRDGVEWTVTVGAPAEGPAPRTANP